MNSDDIKEISEKETQTWRDLRGRREKIRALQKKDFSLQLFDFNLLFLQQPQQLMNYIEGLLNWT